MRFTWISVIVLASGSIMVAQIAAPATQTKNASSPGISAPATSTDNLNDPIFDVPPMPKGNATLVGGMIDKYDAVGQHITVKPFGNGKKIRIAFDDRSRFFSDGAETTFGSLKKGQRVYVDTLLDGHQILAKNVRIVNKLGPADARGQIIAAENGRISVQDQLSAQTVSFAVDSNTQVKGASRSLEPGSLVAVKFAPDRANRGVAREVTVLANPGNSFTFAGRVTGLNLRSGMLSLENKSDDKNYEIAFDPTTTTELREVIVGDDVAVDAVFDGKQYKGATLTTYQAPKIRDRDSAEDESEKTTSRDKDKDKDKDQVKGEKEK